jgi:acetyltransferase-like isoleucine patch superfamily enzyme/glycosyltransferase involved in cell wall biosynthesis
MTQESKLKLIINKINNRIFGEKRFLNQTFKMAKYEKYEIGRFTYGEPRILDWNGATKLKIGKFCSISSDVVIFLDGNHNYKTLSTYPLDLIFEDHLYMSESITTKGNVNIGNDVWIGLGATIMSGVTIGDGAIIGARCLVSKDVEPYSIIAGNPQKTVGTRFSVDKINELLKLQWWNLSLDALYSLTYIHDQRRNQDLNLISRLSVAIVIYNEERHLKACLDSLGTISNDIVIIHDGTCTDKSKEIADVFGARFVERPHIGIAEGHRIDSFNLTMGDWILVLDADERLSDELRQAIPFLINDDRFDAYEFIWPLYDGGRVICNSWPNKKALFRKSKIKYIDFPQAEVSTNGNIRRTGLTLKHEPDYNNFTYERFIRKWVRWAKIQAKLTLKDFSDVPKLGYDTQKNWTKNFLFKRNHPELFILYGLYDAFKSFKSGAYENKYALKAAFMWGLYNAIVYYYVSKEKWLKKLS